MWDTFINKLKKLNLKYVIKSFVMVWGLILIVIMTITNIGITKEFDFIQWLGNSLIIFGISVFGLLMGETTGEDRQAERTDGIYQTTLREYKKVRNSVEDIICYFFQFYDWFLPQDLESKKIMFLLDNGFAFDKAKAIVKHCSIDDLRVLLTQPLEIKNKDDKVVARIRKITQEEYDVAICCFDGTVKLQANSPNYFLTDSSKSKSTFITEEGNVIDKYIKFNKHSNRIVKITTSLGISLAFGLLTVNDFMSGNDAQAWMNLISRITALFTSFLSGWLSAVIDVKLKAQKVENKITMLTIFKNAYDKEQFKPKSEEELFNEEQKKFEEEQKEARESVIVPEIETTPLLEDKTAYSK